jgi:hypothetical protein
MKERVKWTFMVYLAGDNDLEAFGAKDLSEMKVAGSSDELSIVAQFDRMSDQITRRYHLTRHKSLEGDCVDELPEVNTGDPKALQDFITWASAAFPAERYALVLWNHGSGWKDDDIYHSAEKAGVTHKIGRGQMRGLTSGKPSRALFSTTLDRMVTEATERAILFDDSSADFLDSQELRRVLRMTAPAVGGAFDLLGFDACLMSMLEIHYQIRDMCGVIVSSQEVEPGDGWPYDAVLTQLGSDPTMGAVALGRVIVGEYVDFYRKQYPNWPVTQSAINAEAIEPVARAASALGSALKNALSTSSALGRVFAALRRAQSYSDRDAITGAESPVIEERHHGDQVANSHGISAYLPARVLSPLYSQLEYARQFEWDEFLDALVHPD